MNNADVMNQLVLVLTPVFLLLDAIVTRALLRDSNITTAQRIFQIAFVWLVPFVGAIAVYFVLAYHHTKEEMRSLLPFPFYLIYREPIEPGGYGEIGGDLEGSCGGDLD